MTEPEWRVHAERLLKEHGWTEAHPEVLLDFRDKCDALAVSGIEVTPEVMEFLLDVIQAIFEIKNWSNDELVPGVPGFFRKLTAWLEAMGWRRGWFEKTVQLFRS